MGIALWLIVAHDATVVWTHPDRASKPDISYGAISANPADFGRFFCARNSSMADWARHAQAWPVP